VGTLVETIHAALDGAGTQTLVTDVGSTKRLVAEAISDPRFIGGHPLAGSEASGVAHAREDLFDGAVWYLTIGSGSQSPVSDPSGYDRLAALIRAFGAQPAPIDPDLHDRLMATVSHLPHVLANLLVAQALASLGDRAPAVGGVTSSPSPLGMGPSFRDATRVAGSNSAIWTDIYMSNRAALIAAIDELTGRLAQVRAALGDGDADALTAWNERARAERAALLGSGS
jgi:prephenate dehydrogenase